MVEPLHPDLRRQLKQAHSGLTDADIDRLEELTALRYTLDPERDAEQLRTLDQERERLLAEKLPRYREVYQAYTAEQRKRGQTARAEPTFTIEPGQPPA